MLITLAKPDTKVVSKARGSRPTIVQGTEPIDDVLIKVLQDQYIQLVGLRDPDQKRKKLSLLELVERAEQRNWEGPPDLGTNHDAYLIEAYEDAKEHTNDEEEAKEVSENEVEAI